VTAVWTVDCANAAVDEPAHAADLGLDNGHPPATGVAETFDAK